MAAELETAWRLAESYRAALLQRAESPSLLLSAWLVLTSLLFLARQLLGLQHVSRTVEPLRCLRALLVVSPVSFITV